jgi:hypothetical protein
MFLQVDWPVFLIQSPGYERGPIKPKLPDNYDELDSEEKKLAEFERDQATRTKAYEICSYRKNRDAHQAMNIPSCLRELFLRCGETWAEGVIPLRACLIQIYLDWEELGFMGECPYDFSEQEIAPT